MKKEKDIIHEIKSLENAIARYIFRNIKKDPKLLPPSPMQMAIINYLVKNQNKEIYQKDLEYVFKVRRASISGVLQTLEKRGFIEKVGSAEDARVNKIILTKKAIEKQKEVSKDFLKLKNKLTKNIEKENLEVFYDVIKQMRNNIE